MEKGHNSLSESVLLERRSLSDVKSRATNSIDTSHYSNARLKEEIGRLFGDENSAPGMLIVVQSFGYKYGLPLDSDLILDVRFLPNPFYEENLKKLTGNDEPVYLIPQYEKEGKSQLVISVGCTGGQHRSVYIANNIYNYLRLKSYRVELLHREINQKD